MAGRKNRYDTHVKPFLKEIGEWYQSLNEKQICEKLGVSIVTWQKYKNDHEELRNVLQKSKEILIADLKKSLRMKAKGFHYTETKTYRSFNADGEEVIRKEVYEKYAQPDTGAIHLLLKNLDPTWKNDDEETMKLKREKLELEKKRIENDIW